MAQFEVESDGREFLVKAQGPSKSWQRGSPHIYFRAKARTFEEEILSMRHYFAIGEIGPGDVVYPHGPTPIAGCPFCKADEAV